MSRAPRAAPLADGDLFEFFHERVESAVSHQRARVSPGTVYYLSSMLAERGRAEEGDGDRTLVELRERAVTAPPGEAVGWWRRLGDESLIVVGWFREQVERRRVSREYCASMGMSAYDRLARLLRGPSDGFGAVFAELGERFETCAEVIAEVRDESRERNDSDIVALYEEWLQTGSPRVAERLRVLGLVPVRSAARG